MPRLIEITDSCQRSLLLCEMHKRWTPTMQVSVWGRSKATRVDKDKCPDVALIGKAQYKGDCDNCEWFMGARFESRQYYWGDHAPACCALELEAMPAQEGRND